MKNIFQIHDNPKDVSSMQLYKAALGNVISLHIKANCKLNEHSTPVEALLICLDASVIFEDEKGNKIPLNKGDYYNIEPNVIHWVIANADSQLLIVK